jgi:hypothetical protein
LRIATPYITPTDILALAVARRLTIELIASRGSTVGIVASDGSAVGIVTADGSAVGLVAARGSAVGIVTADRSAVGIVTADGSAVGIVTADGSTVAALGVRARGIAITSRRSAFTARSTLASGAAAYCARAAIATAATRLACGNDLQPAFAAFALGSRAHAHELRQRDVHHTPITRGHRLERDDATMLHGAFRFPLGHRDQTVVVALAIVARVQNDVTTCVWIAIDDLVDQELECFQRLALLADRSPGILAGDVDHDLIVVVTDRCTRIELHAIQDALGDAPSFLGFVVIVVARTTRCASFFAFAFVDEQRPVHVLSTLVHDSSSEWA